VVQRACQDPVSLGRCLLCAFVWCSMMASLALNLAGLMVLAEALRSFSVRSGRIVQFGVGVRSRASHSTGLIAPEQILTGVFFAVWVAAIVRHPTKGMAEPARKWWRTVLRVSIPCASRSAQ
jgi:hypothetical protein